MSFLAAIWTSVQNSKQINIQLKIYKENKRLENLRMTNYLFSSKSLTELSSNINNKMYILYVTLIIINIDTIKIEPQLGNTLIFIS